MVEGVSHITWMVRDLARTGAMLEAVLGARMVYESGEQGFSLAPERFYELGGVWLCIMRGDGPSAPTYDHVAFQVPKDDLAAIERRVRAAGLAVRPSRARVAGEGCSLYFSDYDNHLIELHAGTLAERLACYGAKERLPRGK